MIAKINHGTNLMGALIYNFKKVENLKAEIIFTQKIAERADGVRTIYDLFDSFEPYLIANRKTEKPSLHISLNPDPKDRVDDPTFILLAKDYMEKMGYGNQAFVLFKHTDIERAHLHIVSVNIDRHGRKISDSFEKRKSMSVCRELENKYNLHPTNLKENESLKSSFHPVDYKKGDLKSQISSIVRYIPSYYKFSTLGSYNALLSLFNIRAEKVENNWRGIAIEGLVYFALNEKAEKAGPPFKSSLFGKKSGMKQLELDFSKFKDILKNHPSKKLIQSTIEMVLHSSSSESDFKKSLVEQGINTVVHKNKEGRIYGITFIDHESRTVWNGSQLGKGFSANRFNEIWNEVSPQDIDKSKPKPIQYSMPNENRHSLKSSNFSTIDFIFPMTDFVLAENLFFPLQTENSEEIEFEKKRRKKKKRKKS